MNIDFKSGSKSRGFNFACYRNCEKSGKYAGDWTLVIDEGENRVSFLFTRDNLRELEGVVTRMKEQMALTSTP